MQEYSNPFSGKKIKGLKLFDGAFLRMTDVCASTTGDWIELVLHDGLILKSNNNSLWIRPNACISAQAKSILAYLKKYNFALANKYTEWLIISSTRRKKDGRFDWIKPSPEHVQEIVDFGFVLKTFPAGYYEVNKEYVEEIFGDEI